MTQPTTLKCVMIDTQKEHVYQRQSLLVIIISLSLLESSHGNSCINVLVFRTCLLALHKRTIKITLSTLCDSSASLIIILLQHTDLL
jgi:hypothetical protein